MGLAGLGDQRIQLRTCPSTGLRSNRWPATCCRTRPTRRGLATGFHRNHPITIEGGVIDEEYRTEYVMDRVVTTATVWMGLTFICAAATITSTIRSGRRFL